MPVALDVDREAVKTLCIAVGVSEASRRLGIPCATVRQWSCRGKWFAQPERPPTMMPVQPLPSGEPGAVTSVTSPANALKSALQEDSDATRIGLAKAARKVADRLGHEDTDAEEVMDRHKALASVASVASKVHGWDEGRSAAPSFTLNLAIAAGGMVPESQD